MIGRVTAVKTEVAGTELASAAVATDTSLDVLDPDELDGNGGTLRISDETNAEEIAYTIVDDVVELDSALVNAYAVETPVLVHPRTSERVAYFQAPDQAEELHARIPHQLYGLLPEGTREDETEAESVEVALEDGELVVRDVLGREPGVDVGYLSGMEISAGEVSIEVDLPDDAATSDPIAHGLSGTPTAITATIDAGLGRGSGLMTASVRDLDEENFAIRVRLTEGTVAAHDTFGDHGSGNRVTVYWIAILATLLAGQPETDALPSRDIPSYYGAD